MCLIMWCTMYIIWGGGTSGDSIALISLVGRHMISVCSGGALLDYIHCPKQEYISKLGTLILYTFSPLL